MGVRENKVETYLRDQFRLLGGDTRKWVSPGRDGVPDQLCFLRGEVWLVEVKTVDGDFEPSQPREHKRLRALGMRVRTVWGNAGVNHFMCEVQGGPPKHVKRVCECY